MSARPIRPRSACDLRGEKRSPGAYPDDARVRSAADAVSSLTVANQGAVERRCRGPDAEQGRSRQCVLETLGPDGTRVTDQFCARGVGRSDGEPPFGGLVPARTAGGPAPELEYVRRSGQDRRSVVGVMRSMVGEPLGSSVASMSEPAQAVERREPCSNVFNDVETHRPLHYEGDPRNRCRRRHSPEKVSFSVRRQAAPQHGGHDHGAPSDDGVATSRPRARSTRARGRRDVGRG
jgi:hypothetical protein